MTDRNGYDVIIIGGGPSGATSALVLARAGYHVILLEKSRFPRFHIGESFLPRNLTLIRELGLEDRLAALPQIRKLGAEFIMGHGEDAPSFFDFDTQLGDANAEAFNIERAPFDAMLLDAARDAGAEIREGTGIKQITSLADDDVVVISETGNVIHSRILVDASGQATVIGRHLGTRRLLPRHRKVAYYGHYQNVHRHQGDRAGFPTVVMCEEGWFWLIPIDHERTSIGLVLSADAARTVDIPARKMLRWAIDRCPVMRERTRDALAPEVNDVTADFSYRCEPHAGSGYFLVGDAAMFVDPIFSTGVCLGMMSASRLPGLLDRLLGRCEPPERVRRDYCRYLKQSSDAFFELVDDYYRREFRDLFLHGYGPFRVHQAVIAILTGQVFPRPPFAMRWRMQLFHAFMRLHQYVRIVPRRKSFFLIDPANGSTADARARPGALQRPEPMGTTASS